MFCAVIATLRAATYDSITKTILAHGNPFDDTFVAEMAEYACLGIKTVGLMPSGDPVAFVQRVGAELVGPLTDLG